MSYFSTLSISQSQKIGSEGSFDGQAFDGLSEGNFDGVVVGISVGFGEGSS